MWGVGIFALRLDTHYALALKYFCTYEMKIFIFCSLTIRCARRSCVKSCAVHNQKLLVHTEFWNPWCWDEIQLGSSARHDVEIKWSQPTNSAQFITLFIILYPHGTVMSKSFFKSSCPSSCWSPQNYTLLYLLNVECSGLPTFLIRLLNFAKLWNFSGTFLISLLAMCCCKVW